MVWAGVGSRNTKISCTARGNPLPKVIWTLGNGTEAPPAGYEDDYIMISNKVKSSP